jgi:tetratricopeptide (TPR) repeat protein
MEPAMSQLSELLREIHQRSIWQVIGIYLAMSWGVLNAVDVLTGFAGLPDWTPTMAVVLLLIGFPIVTATAVIQKGMPGGGGGGGAPPGDDQTASMEASQEGDGTDARSRSGAPSTGAAPSSTGDAPDSAGATPGGLRSLFTWRNALLGGAAAGALLLVSGGVYLAMWSLGVGPVGSLVAQGVLDESDPVLLVDFVDRAGDGDLGTVVAQALAVDLNSSPTVTLLSGDAVSNALRLMGRDAAEPVTDDLAREISLRINIKAFIAGEVSRVGSRYLIVARIVSPQTGQDLVSFREEAAGEDDLLPAIDRISQSLREKLGESLRDIRLGAPLEDVTTTSFEALRKLTQAERAEEEGDYALSERLLNEAIVLDPDFAMAYRKLSVIRFNAGQSSALINEAATLAYEHRDRLSDRERYLTEANYHRQVTRNDQAALDAYDAILEIRPDDAAALNNSSLILTVLTRFQESQERLDRAVGGGGGGSSVAFLNHGRTRLLRGDQAGALASIAEYRDRYPGHIYQPWADLLETIAAGENEGLDRRITALRDAPDMDFFRPLLPRYHLAAEITRGDLGGALERAADVSLENDRFTHAGFLSISTGVPDVRLWILDDSTGAVDALQTLLLGPRFDTVAAQDRSWGASVTLYALAGRPDLARSLRSRWEAETVVTAPGMVGRYAAAGAMIEWAEGRPDEALREIEAAVRDMGCPRCFEQQRAIILETLERYDEAIEIWETVRDYPVDLEAGGWERIVALKRLGPLHELAGDAQGAIAAYQAFADAWADADPELQPQVAHARARVAALGG